MKNRYLKNFDEGKPDLPPPSTWLGVVARVWDYGWPRFRRWLKHRKPQNRILLRLDNLAIYVEDDDKGRADFRIDVINFSHKRLQLDYIELRFWKAGSNALRDQSNLINASGSIGKRSIATGYCSISLSSSDIRDIVKGVDSAPHVKLIPRAVFELHGKCIFNFETTPIRVEFSFNKQCDGINIPLNILDRICGITTA